MANGQITLSKEQFKEMHDTVEKLESIMETIEIMSDKELMESIERSEEDVKAGRVKKLKDVEDIKKW